MIRHFDHTSLQLVSLIVDERSMTKAAERMHISVAAASMRIKNLESLAGIKLFRRLGQGIAPTPAGETVARHARIIETQLDQLWSELQEQALGTRGRLRIFANTTSVYEYLPRVLDKYLPAHPGIDVDIRDKMTHEAVRGVIEGQADIGIIISDVNKEQNVEVRPYRQNRMVAIVSPGHPLTKLSRPIRFASTLDYEHIGLPEKTGLHILLKQLSTGMNKALRMRMVAEDFEIACRMVASNSGIAIIPEVVAVRYVQTLAIHILPLEDYWAKRSLQICALSFNELPPFATDLVDLLLADPGLEAIPDVSIDSP
ncbi:LysR family transcriptional regulator [Alcaligenaceae bacterium]|nr:LysR family transcriptional regulator [Alcaligenaceae bacterium]